MIERARGQVAELGGLQAFGGGVSPRVRPRRPRSCGMVPGCGVVVDETAHDCLWAHHTGPGETSTTLAMGLANSETGVLTLPEKGESGWRYGDVGCDWLLLDVVQAVGRVPFSFHWSGADFAILSAHKLGGPEGRGRFDRAGRL